MPNLLADFKEKNALVLAALVELSQVLPNDTFVSDLIFKEGVFEINGLSGQAAALPQIIDNSPLFKGRRIRCSDYSKCGCPR